MKQTVKTSRAAGQLEKMFRALNTRFFDGKLPEPVITLKKTPPVPMVTSLAAKRGQRAQSSATR